MVEDKVYIVRDDKVLNLITTSKQNIYKKINTALIELYWKVEKYISQKTIKNPTIKGFNSRELWRIKQFYEIYKDNKKLSPLLTQILWSNHLSILCSSKREYRR